MSSINLYREEWNRRKAQEYIGATKIATNRALASNNPPRTLIKNQPNRKKLTSVKIDNPKNSNILPNKNLIPKSLCLAIEVDVNPTKIRKNAGP